MKIAAAQMNTRACDIAGNIKKIIAFWEMAEEQNVDLVLTPEQSISGYPLEDHAANPDILKASKEGRDYLIELSKQKRSGIIVGLPEQDKNGQIYNVAYLIENGNCSPAIQKQHLPNYDVHDEKRIYSEGNRSDLIEFRGFKLGILICEDIWKEDVIADLVAKGADVILALNASPFYVGKHTNRLENVLKQRIIEEENIIPILYVNQVGGQDEIVFDGYSTAMNPDGSIAMMARGFEESLLTLTLKKAESGLCSFKEGEINEIYSPEEEVWNALVLGLRDYIEKSGLKNKKVCLGMSGGLDSAVVAALAVDALGANQVTLYKLPSQYTSDTSKDDADIAAEMLGTKIQDISIQPAVALLLETLSPFFNENAHPDQIALGEENLQARLRGLFLMTLSNVNGDLLLSTGNKSEVSVGYCTLYGDMNGGFNPLKDVPKTLTYDLANWRNSHYPRNVFGKNGYVIPQNIIEKKPSAELRPDQLDEESLPPYPELDDILERYVEREQSIDQIIDETNYEESVVTEIISKTDIAEFKRRQACPGIKITQRSFGQGRRVPIARPTTPQTISEMKRLTL